MENSIFDDLKRIVEEKKANNGITSVQQQCTENSFDGYYAPNYHGLTQSCPNCGYCPSCGRGGYPYYRPIIYCGVAN